MDIDRYAKARIATGDDVVANPRQRTGRVRCISADLPAACALSVQAKAGECTGISFSYGIEYGYFDAEAKKVGSSILRSDR